MSGENRVAVIGAGTIGASWAACFLQHGMEVVATDPAPGAETALRREVEAELSGRDPAAMVAQRDGALVGLLKAKAALDQLP